MSNVRCYRRQPAARLSVRPHHRSPGAASRHSSRRSRRATRGDIGRRSIAALLIALLILTIGTGVATAIAIDSAKDVHDGTGSSLGSDSAPPGSSRDRGRPAAVGVSGSVHAEWDGPTTHVDWRGRSYVTAESSFVGSRVVSPGDSVERTLRLQNDGGDDALMSVTLELTDGSAGAHPDPAFAEAVEMFWNVSGVTGRQKYSALLQNDSPEIAQVHVPRAGTAVVSVGFAVPATVTGGNGSASTSSPLGFRVLATMHGEETATPAALAWTGQDIAFLLGAATISLALSSLGLLLIWLTRRRRRCDECGENLGPTHALALHHSANGEVARLCDDCRGQGWHLLS